MAQPDLLIECSSYFLEDFFDFEQSDVLFPVALYLKVLQGLNLFQRHLQKYEEEVYR